VVAIVQPSVEGDTLLYALDVRYAMDLAVKALSINDPTYRALRLRKALPADTAQALVSLYLATDHSDAALRAEVIDEFIGCYPQHREGYLSRAAHHIALGTDSALSLAEEDHARALAHAEDKADEVHFQIAKQILSVAVDTLRQYKDWNYARSLAEIDKARAVNPLPIYAQQQGDIYIMLKNYTAAYEKFMEVNRSDIGSPDTWLRTAYAIEQRAGEGDVELVIALLDSAVNKAALSPQTSALNQTAPYVLERALFKARNGLHRPAVVDYNLYEEMVGTINTDRFYYLREQSEAASRMYQQALDDIRRAITLAPQQPLYLLELATLNVRIARYADAVPILEVLVANFPDDLDCNRLLGFCYIQLGDKARGVPYLEKAAAWGDVNAKVLLERM
jgi:tetratricopeptide (TPR) repeat protein